MSGNKIDRTSFQNHYINWIGLALLISFFYLISPASKWDKTISGDGKSYYAYLTAAVIYQDLDYRFVEDYEAKYYPPDQSLFKEFRQDFNGEIVNKTFPGITLLWLPFFLLAHFLSYLLGFEMDGYSVLYQYAIGMAAIFYVWLGLKWTNQLLKSLGFSWGTAVSVLLIIVFGTNLFYYTIHDPSLTHAYSFFLLAGMLHFTNRFYFEQKTKLLTLAISLYALAIIVRPTNILMLLFLPFAFSSLLDLKVFLRSIFSSKKFILVLLGIPLLMALYPIIWWYAQAGQPIVYSYGNEGFDFSNPHFYQMLFSYEKGWLVYSPVILLSLIGLIQLYRKQRFLFFSGMIGFILLTYVFSCWWIWTYGASFGQRVFVDYYVIICIFLAAGLQSLHGYKALKYIWGIIALGLVGLNLLQTYQFQNGILPSVGATKTTYWASFFKLKSIHHSHPISVPHKAIKYFETDFEEEAKWMVNFSRQNEYANSGKFSQHITENKPYSGGFKGQIVEGADYVQVEAKIYCKHNSASPQLVYELAGNSKTDYRAVGLMPYLEKSQWIHFFHVIDLSSQSYESLNTYFWNPTQHDIWIDDLKITFGVYQ